MNRRLFLGAGVGLGVIAAGGAGALIALGAHHAAPTSKWSLEVLDQLEAHGLDAIQMQGAWSLSQVLSHLAQSIEFSMSGFPEMKPDLFLKTVGPAAFAVFTARGELSHGLADAIPGAPPLDASVTPTAAMTRLRDAIAAFDRHSAALQPHFAYGPLSHTEYERAHALHLADHLHEFGGVVIPGAW